MIEHPAAVIFFRGDRGCALRGVAFFAEHYERIPGVGWYARGRMRHTHGGSDTPTYSWGDLVEREWPSHRIHEVRPTAELAAA